MSGVVRLRPRRWRLLMVVHALFVALWVTSAVFAWLTSPRNTPQVVASAGCAGMYLLLPALVARGFAVLSPSGYWGRRPFRRGLRLTWADVRGLHVQVVGRRTRVVATRQDGGTVVLPFPAASRWAADGSGADSDWFARQYRRVGETWAGASRGSHPDAHVA